MGKGYQREAMNARIALGGSEVTNKGLRACVRASGGFYQCLIDLNIHKLLQELAWVQPNILKIDFLTTILKNSSFLRIYHGIL